MERELVYEMVTREAANELVEAFDDAGEGLDAVVLHKPNSFASECTQVAVTVRSHKEQNIADSIFCDVLESFEEGSGKHQVVKRFLDSLAGDR